MGVAGTSDEVAAQEPAEIELATANGPPKWSAP